MAQIVRINKGKVYIGLPNGLIREFYKEDLSFEPEVGKEVEFYTNGNKYIIISDGQYDYIDKCTVNKYIYGSIILIFGGPIGLHKFYAKKYLAGILYLVYCWTFILALIALFYDLPIALFKRADENGNIKV